MITLTKLLAKYPTTMTITRMPSRTDKGGASFGKGARHWLVVLSSHDAEHFVARRQDNVSRASAVVQYSQGSAHIKTPTVREIVECLVSDRSCIESYSGVDDFAAEMGFVKPAEALRAWKGCEQAAGQLTDLYGADAAEIDTEGD